MIDIYTLLVIAHLFGSALGLGGATFIEVFLNKSLKDGVMDPTEKLFMSTTYQVLRIGLVISLVTGLGFVVYYLVNDQVFRMNNGIFVAKMLIIVIMLVNAYLLQIHQMKLWWGSTLSFMSWYFAFLLGTFLTHAVRFGFWEIMVTYAIFIFAGGYVLEWFRNRSRTQWLAAQPTKPPQAPPAAPQPPASR